jgi:cytochrome c5
MNARALVWGTVGAVILAGCQKGTPSAQAPAAADTTRAPSSLPQISQRLLEAASIALPPGTAAESLPEPTSAGATILRKYCTQCHALPSPAMHGPVDWPGVARRMWVRIDMMAGGLGIQTPSTAERSQLLAYLQANALKVAAHLPAGPGKDAFETTCSRCHALADPMSHSPADWPVVVMRMEKNMEKMKVSGVTHDQATQIVAYLQRASQRRSR